MTTLIYNAAGKLIHQSRNLRGIVTHKRGNPIVGVECMGVDSDGYSRIDIQFENGDFSAVMFADWRVAADWFFSRARNATFTGYTPFLRQIAERMAPKPRDVIRDYAQWHCVSYRITRDGQVHLYGPMPNSFEIGWWLFAQSVTEALERIDGKR